MAKPIFKRHVSSYTHALIRFLTLVALAAGAISSPAQNVPKASNAPTSNSSSSEHVPDNSPAPDSQDDTAATLKVNVDVVQLFFNVKDKHGALIPNLAKDNFELFEDGKQQNIKYFKAESDLPLTMGILIDSSGSQQRVLDMEKEVGASFLENIIRTKDEAFVISFDVDITLLQDFTNSVSRLRHALNEAKINTGGVGCSSGPIGPQGPIPCGSSGPRGTALYDAVYLAAHDELSREVGRKAMVLLTDGEDQGSRLKIKDAIEAAQKADVICYVLLIADRTWAYGFGGYSGDSEMKKLTQETGGRVIEVGNKIEKLRKAFDDIAAELRSQYNLGYTPTNANLDGGFRKVEIKSRQGDYKIQARSGYYAIKHQEQ
ncbi:MAG TPA: VWA domain-containing protein [Terriglobales bacterium]|nr:VWA domain-containing protein [Terriglobales bacterium]